jgi:hypothetical protein
MLWGAARVASWIFRPLLLPHLAAMSVRLWAARAVNRHLLGRNT